MATTVGDRIREMRRRRGVSQASLVAGIPLSSSYLSLIESGRRQPRERVLEVIAHRLGCTPEYLTTGRGGPGSGDVELDLRFADVALRAGDAGAARARFRDVRDLAIQLGFEDIAHDARWGLCRAEEALGNLEAAIEELEELSGEPVLKGTFTRTALARRLARNHLESNELTRAIEVAQQGLAEAASNGLDDDEVTELASTLVACYYERGDLTRAHLLVRKVIADAERSSSPRARAAAYWNAGLVAEARGDLRSARAFTDRALVLYSESDNRRATALVRLNCAWLILRTPDEDRAEAARLLERALGELAEVGTEVDMAAVETELARCRLLDGDAAEAARTARSAMDRLAGGQRLETARARAVLAEAELAMGLVDAAVVSCAAAASDLAEAGASRQAAETWRELADALTAMGMLDEAINAYQRTADAAGVPRRREPARNAMPEAVPTWLPAERLRRLS